MHRIGEVNSVYPCFGPALLSLTGSIFRISTEVPGTLANSFRTNAVKFTKDQEVRNITVTLGGSWTHEAIDIGNVTFASDTPPQTNVFNKPEWGNGRLGYIWLRVDDTGCGIAEDEQKNLFSRFSQATPRKYSPKSHHTLIDAEQNRYTHKIWRLRPWSLHLEVAHRFARWLCGSQIGSWTRFHLCVLRWYSCYRRSTKYNQQQETTTPHSKSYPFSRDSHEEGSAKRTRCMSYFTLECLNVASR